jgi:hypothetical protein
MNPMIFRHPTFFLRNHGRISKGALERSSSTISREINPRVSTEYWKCRVILLRVYYSFQRVVVTLDPNKFAEKKQRRLHIGNIRGFRPYVALHNQSNPVRVPRLYYNYNAQEKPRRSSYPSDTSAFLYYFTTPEKPRIAGELRLRVASSDDHASFESGSDLLRLDGRPWSRSLCNVSKNYIPLYEKLREEGFVSDDLDAVLSTFTKLPNGRCQSIYTLNDPFIVDFSCNRLFSVVTEKGMEILLLKGTFEDQRPTRMMPYTGAYTNHHLSSYDLINL